MNEFSWIFLIALALMTGVECWLSLRQRRHVLANRHAVPKPFDKEIGLDAHQKAADYTVAKGAFKRGESIYSAAILLLWTFGGGLAILNGAWGALDWSPMATGIAFLISFLLIGSVLDLPLGWYKTFVMEERFGFNRNTPKLFLADFFKSLVLLVVMGIPLVWGALWLMGSAGELWWLYLWAAMMGVVFIMMWAYPAFIAPLFNKFTPLENDALKSRVEQLLKRCGFKSQGIFVMDGSRRSGHGNAYFTGIGNNKRIVFFDTLLDTLNADQIEAVLAHELGHFRRKHVVKNMLLMSIISLVGLAFLGWASSQSWFYQGLGVTTESNAMALALFMVVVPVFMFFLSPLMTAMSRKYEYEADEYAASVADSNDLVTALVALYKENASTLTTDPLVSAIYDSHPPASMRIAALQANNPA